MSHTCHAINCRESCKPEHLMCAKHWDMVTSYAKERVYAEYQEGQCTRDGGPTPQWHSAADAAIYQVRVKELTSIARDLHLKSRERDTYRDLCAELLQALNEISGLTDSPKAYKIASNAISKAEAILGDKNGR